MGLEDVLKELEFLKTWIGNIDSNVKFNITMQWAALAFVITAAGTALYYLAKVWFEKFADKKIDKMKCEIIEEVTNYKSINTLSFSAYTGDYTISIPNDSKACIINAYFVEDKESIRFIKNSLTATKKDISLRPISIRYGDNKKITIKLKELRTDYIILTWDNEGDVPDFHIGLEILVF